MFESIVYKQPLPIWQCTFLYSFANIQKNLSKIKRFIQETKDFLVFSLKFHINIFDTNNIEEARDKLDGFMLGLYSYNISVMLEKIIDIDPSKLDNIFKVTTCKNIFNPTKEEFGNVIADKLEAVAKKLRTLKK